MTFFRPLMGLVMLLAITCAATTPIRIETMPRIRVMIRAFWLLLIVACIRQNRLLSLNAAQSDSAYIDRERVSQGIAVSKKLCAKHAWPSIDVSRRSIEETAAAVIGLLQERRRNVEPS